MALPYQSRGLCSYNCLPLPLSFSQSWGLRILPAAFRTLGSASEQGRGSLLTPKPHIAWLTYPTFLHQWFWPFLPQQLHYHRIIIPKVSPLFSLTHIFTLPPTLPLLLSSLSRLLRFLCADTHHPFLKTLFVCLQWPFFTKGCEVPWFVAWIPRLYFCIHIPFLPLRTMGRLLS